MPARERLRRINLTETYGLWPFLKDQPLSETH